MNALILLCFVAAASAVREPVEKTCTEDPETGLCRAYIPSYYYDRKVGTCKPFIYGGCGGNGNRYMTEEECMENCSGVGPEEQSCILDKETGPCYARFERYYYNSNSGKCEMFTYGGCRGNGNNFKTVEECQKACSPAPQAALDRPDCDKAPEAGLCDAYIPRFYYDQEAGMCKTFIYGGCGGNRNNFRTKDECYNKCGALRAPDSCHLEPDTGLCRGYFPRYYYDVKSGSCKTFVYGGCGGNENKYETEEECLSTCSPLRAPDRCNMKAETGLCKGYFPRYYYDAESQSCKTFIYGGCGGNENNFETEGECLDVCSA